MVIKPEPGLNVETFRRMNRDERKETSSNIQILRVEFLFLSLFFACELVSVCVCGACVGVYVFCAFVLLTASIQKV